MSDRVQQVVQLWKEFNLSQYQRDLDKTASEIADRQDRSETSRKKLIELSKTFKKESSDELRKGVAELLKSFQTEVDSLSSRSKAAEVAFLGTYKSLLDLPDPTPVFTQLSAFQDRANRVVELEAENQRLRARNQEFEQEFQELRNQDVTVKQLRDRVKSLETELEATIEAHGEEARKKIEEEFEDKERALKENTAVLAKKLGESERRVIQLQKAFDAAQTELFEARSKDEIRSHARSEEVDLILSDLDKALQRAVSAEKECEELRAALEDKREDGDGGNVIETQEMARTVKNLQVELSVKDKDIERLVEEVSKLKAASQSEAEDLTHEVSRLSKEMSVTKAALEEAENRLRNQTDYEDLRKEVNMFRVVEFGFSSVEETEGSDDGVARKSLEVLLMGKNKQLQASVTALRRECSELTSGTARLQADNERLNRALKDQRDLVHKLEKDLADVQNVSALCRGEGEGQPASSASEWVLEAVSDLGPSPEPPLTIAMSPTRMMDPATAAENLLPIISAQRERFRERNQELEARNSQLLEQMTLLQTEMQSLRADNLKLYEKIRFLQSYGSSSSTVTISSPAEDRYSSQYEAKLDPFASFSRKELMRKYTGLSPVEKFTLSMGRAILSNKTARFMTLAYTFLLHGLVVLVLYKLAYTEVCQQDAAADCMKRFAEHMAEVHKDHL